MDTSLGLASSLLHAIEASPDRPVWSALDDRNWWVTYLRERELPQLVAAACQVGDLGGVAREFDRFVVRRP